MKCSQCQREAIQNSTWCSECENSLLNKCSNCETELPLSAKFCLECGKDVRKHPSTPLLFSSPRSYTPQHLANKILQSRSAVIGERKHVTVLFCDLVGSSTLAKKLGEEAMHLLLNKFFELAVSEVHRYEGTLNQFLGDGFMALFGAPLTYEDHSQRAALTALGIKQAIMEKGLCNKYAKGQQVSIRFGLNTGPVVVGRIGDDLRMDYTAIGDTTNLAAALEALAEPGTIYLSQQAYRKIEGQFNCIEIKTRFPKSKGEYASVYQLQGEKSVSEFEKPWPRRNLNSSLIGRDQELETLFTCFEQVIKKKGGIAFVLGEPGIGKSRLVAEARRRLSPEGISWLEGRAFSHSQTTSYGLFVDLIKSAVGITAQDSDGDSLAKLERHIRKLFVNESDEIVPYLGTLIALNIGEQYKSHTKYLDSDDMKRHIFLATRRFFERLALEHPLALFFEDVHWSDDSSIRLLEHLLPLIQTVPLLICWISRTEFNEASLHFRRIVDETFSSHRIEIELYPLSKNDSRTVVRSLLGTAVLTRRIEEVTVDKAGGNPFFLEEVVRSLIDAVGLPHIHTANDALIDEHMAKEEVPETVDEVIMARVDRLPEEVKHILKIASVIGRSFLFRVLSSLVPSSEKLEKTLRALKSRDFIIEKNPLPELAYSFKHALLQEAIYESILSSRRRDLHRQVAECIKSLYVDRQEEFYSLLAYHYARGGEEKLALKYLIKAGDQAGQIAADSEALKHYHQATATYTRLFSKDSNPVQRASLERKIGEALFRRGNHGEAQECFYRALRTMKFPYPESSQAVARAILKQILNQAIHRIRHPQLQKSRTTTKNNIAKERSRIYEMLIWIDFFVDPQKAVLDSLLELNLSERHNLSTGIVQGAFTFGLALDAIALSRIAAFYHRSNVSLSEKIGNPRAKGHAYLGLGIHGHYCGEIDDALENFVKAEVAYRHAGNLRGVAAARSRMSRLLWLQGKFSPAVDAAEESIRIGRDGAGHQPLVWGLTTKAGVLRDVGEIDSAILLLREAIEVSEKIPDQQNIATCRANLSKCYLLEGDCTQAMEEIEESCRIIEERKIRGILVTDIYLTAAEVLLCVIEKQAGQENTAMRQKAKNACKAACSQGKVDRLATPSAYCFQGTFFWLTGNHRQSKKWWMQSVESAKKLGMEHKLGLTYLEVGRRTGDKEALKQAIDIFKNIGAVRDRNATIELLN